MTDEAPMLACYSVSRTIQRNGHAALKLLENISFFVEQGATLAVLGASGAGKSTLLRLLNRLDEPSGGQIMLAGKNTAEIDARQLRRKVGMVMQRAYLFPGRGPDTLRAGPAQYDQATRDAQVAGPL